jgi:hypothetical protein
MQWNKTYGGASYDVAWSILQTPDGGYILGGLTYSFGAGHDDLWIIRTDATGTVIWESTYGGGASDTPAWRALAPTSDGGHLIAGTTASYGNGGFDGWLVKIDEMGEVQWTKTLGGTNIIF